MKVVIHFQRFPVGSIRLRISTFIENRKPAHSIRLLTNRGSPTTSDQRFVEQVCGFRITRLQPRSPDAKHARRFGGIVRQQLCRFPRQQRRLVAIMKAHLRISAVPSLYLLDEQGNIIWRLERSPSPEQRNELERLIQRRLNNRVF